MVSSRRKPSRAKSKKITLDPQRHVWINTDDIDVLEGGVDRFDSRHSTRPELKHSIAHFRDPVKPSFVNVKTSSNAKLWETSHYHLCFLAALASIIAGVVYLGIDFFTEKVDLCVLMNVKGNLYCEVLVSVVLVCLARAAVEVAPEAKGSGIPEVKCMLSGCTVLAGFLSWKVLVCKAFSIAFLIKSGLPLGKEGPFVHIAACVNNELLRWRFFTRIKANQGRECVLLAAVAVGAGCTLTAPIGGVLFAFEMMMPRLYHISAYLTCFLAPCCVFLFMKFVPEHLRGQPLFVSNIPSHQPVGCLAMLLSYLLCCSLGCLMGILAGLLVKVHALMTKCTAAIQSCQFQSCQCNYDGKAQHLTGKVRLRKFWNPLFFTDSALLIVVVVVHILLIYSEEGQVEELLRIGSKEALQRVIFIRRETYALSILVMVFFWKAYLTCVVLSMPAPTGCIAPILVIGAFAGQIFAYFVPDGLVKWIDPDESPEAFGARMAIIGATTLAGGFCRTLSIVITVCELLAIKNLSLPLALATICSCCVASRIAPSYFDSLLTMLELPALPTLLAHKKALQSITEIMIPIEKVAKYSLRRRDKCASVGVIMDKIDAMGDKAPNLIPILEVAQIPQRSDCEASVEVKTYLLIGAVLNAKLNELHAELTESESTVQDILDTAAKVQVLSTPLEVSPNLTIQDVFLRCQAQNYQHTIMVVQHGLLVGLVTQKQLLDLAS